MNELPTSKVEVVSEYLVTPPTGDRSADFLNGCLKLRTLLYPYELLAELNGLRKKQEESESFTGVERNRSGYFFMTILFLEEADLYSACRDAQEKVRAGTVGRDRSV